MGELSGRIKRGQASFYPAFGFPLVRSAGRGMLLEHLWRPGSYGENKVRDSKPNVDIACQRTRISPRVKTSPRFAFLARIYIDSRGVLGALCFWERSTGVRNQP